MLQVSSTSDRANRKATVAASNHSPLFYVDESGLGLGVRALAHVAVDFLRM